MPLSRDLLAVAAECEDAPIILSRAACKLASRHSVRVVASRLALAP